MIAARKEVAGMERRKSEKRTTLLRRLRKDRFLLLMVLPGALYLLINNYLPMFGTIIAFKKINYSKGIWGSDWIGFKNFEYLFKTPDAWTITRNTILYNLVFIVSTLVTAVLFAVMLNELRNRLSPP
ncbi:sugar ABC transporter permease, partial [Gordoniibacillus kamchatkensis]